MWMDIAAQDGEAEPRSDEEDTVYDRTNPFRKSGRNPFEGDDGGESQVMIDEGETRCGLFSWRPVYLQRLVNKTVFSVIFTVVAVFQGAIWTYYSSTISTFEKRFRIDSVTSGVLLFVNELAQILVAVLFTYFGLRRHRAKVITVGVALCSLSCFFLASPHYFLGRGEMTSVLVKGAVQPLQIHSHMEGISLNPKSLMLLNEDGAENGDATVSSIVTAASQLASTNESPKPKDDTSGPPNGTVTSEPTTAKDPPKEAAANDSGTTATAENKSETSGAPPSPSTSTTSTSSTLPSSSKENAETAEATSLPEMTSIPFLNDEMTSVWPMCSRDTEDILGIENRTRAECRTKEKERNVAFSLTFVGNFIGGVASMLFLMAGGPFSEDSAVFPNELPRIFGITMAIRLIGTFFGYLFAWSCLTEYITPMAEVAQIDSRWLGAYWLGWTCLGVFMAIFTFIFALFPRQCPREFLKKRSLTHETGMSMLLIPATVPFFGGAEQKTANLFPSILNIPGVFQGLMRNKIYLLLTFSTIMHIFVSVGYFTFLPKYVEYMFRVKAADAAILTGVSSVPFQVGGLMLGGAFISRYMPNPEEISYWAVIVTALHIVGLTVMSFLGCTTDNINVDFLQHRISLQSYLHEDIGNVTAIPLTTTIMPDDQLPQHFCSADCDCKVGPILPICDVYAGNVYYSPCQAGCESVENQTKFHHCSCLPENVTLTEGYCPSDNCSDGLITFLVFVALMQFLNGTRIVGRMLLSYKSLQGDQRAAIIGFTLIVLSLLSTIPSPIVFGSLFESACTVREDMCSETKGNCWLYHNHALRYAFNLSAAAFLLIAFVIDACLWKSRNIRDLRIYDGELSQLTQTQSRSDEQRANGHSFANVALNY